MKDNLKKNIIFIITYIAVIIFALVNFDKILGILAYIIKVLSPFLIGIILAVILNVLVNFIENNLFGEVKPNSKWYKAKRPISITFSLIIVIISDIEYMIILDEVLIFAIIAIIIVDLINIGLYETAMNIIAGTGAFVTMYLIKKLGDVMFKQESLGGGDIKLMFLVGLVIGYPMSVCNIFLATFIAFPIALYLLIAKKDNIIPFGPFLSMAAIILYIWGLTFTDIINFIIH